jgi:hypothetical protein
MKKAAYAALVALTVLAAAACQQSPTGPNLASVAPMKSLSTESGPGSVTTISAGDLMGTWLATKAEGWRATNNGGGFVEVVGSRRDLVAEGATVTLALEATTETVGAASPTGKYTITVARPGAVPGVDTGFWHFGPAWQEQYKGEYQIDFYPARLLPDIEYGEVPSFLIALGGGVMKLWTGGLSFLPYDFGWDLGETGLAFEFIRK